ncbi:MAG: hypothetical protein QOF28_1548 [Actinomycetota bacterium]|nr:hypothetical protein [Actinomycetota bacterium]
MSFLGLVVLVAALTPFFTRGSYRRLAEAPWRWGGLLALGLALQLLLDTDLIPRSRWHDLGFGTLVASYVLLIGFCAGNVLVRGMAVVLIGVALNGFVITVDQGMPVHIPPDWKNSKVDVTVNHPPPVKGDHLLGLTDVIVLRRLDAVISFGDLIIAFGLVDATFWASRRPRRRRAGAPVRVADLAGERDDPDASPEQAAPPVTEPAHARRRSNANPPAPRREPVRTGIGRGPSSSSASSASS